MQAVEHYIEKFVPEHYDLFLDLSRETKTFSGKVTITGQAKSDRISLHQKDLEIASVEVAGQARPFTVDDENEALHIELTEAGSVELVITFSGKITDNMTGIYPSYYTVDGVKKEVLSTQFESHFAREAFPCVDEPEAKATFDLALRFDQAEGELALSNMPEIDVENRKETGIWKFETTPRMSSYLLAFVAGDLQGVTAKTKNGTLVGVYSTKAHPLSNLDFSLDIAVRSIEFYEDYYGVKYPIPQSLHIALPDFSSGAMENWGLVTYREVYLLVDENSTAQSRQTVALVVAHELAHQWFGNLVTMKWWDDLWLNESFANMMEYVAIDALHPEWRMWEDFATNEATAALRRDSLDGVQSVQADVNHPDEISTLFDPAIVYAKGGRLLVMVRKLIGEEAFRTGLKSYFEKFAYKNTVGNDLWQELESASGQPIVNLMNAWISQPGLPVVSVSNSHDTAILSQERFFIGEHQPSNALWPIPLFADQPLDVKILNQKETTVSIEKPLQLNCGLSAHFVTKYDESSREYLLKNITKLPTLDKICILQDATILARAGFENSASLLPLALSLKTETNEKVFGMAAGALTELRKFVDDNDAARDSLKKISGEFARATFEELGWDEKDGESDDDRERRTTALSLMMYSEDEEVLNEAKTRFDNNKLEDLPTEIRALIISTNVRHFETSEMIDNLFAAYKNTPSNDLQNDIAIGLTSTKNPETAEKILANIKDSNIIRPQDASRWFVYLIRTRENRQIAWNWLKENWTWVEDTFGEDKSYDDFIRYAATSLLTTDELNDFQQFFEPMENIPALARTIKLGITEISARAELIERDKADVFSALQTTL